MSFKTSVETSKGKYDLVTLERENNGQGQPTFLHVVRKRFWQKTRHSSTGCGLETSDGVQFVFPFLIFMVSSPVMCRQCYNVINGVNPLIGLSDCP
jgi:hypothetical protein